MEASVFSTYGNEFIIMRSARTSESGQIVVEYVLLLAISVSIAVIVVSQLVKRDPDNPGALISKWVQIQQAIGKDLPQ